MIPFNVCLQTIIPFYVVRTRFLIPEYVYCRKYNAPLYDPIPRNREEEGGGGGGGGVFQIMLT